MKVIYLPTSADHYKKVNVKLLTTTGIYEHSNWMSSNDQLETWASAGSEYYMWYGESKGDMYWAEQQAEKNFASVMSNAAKNSYMSCTASQAAGESQYSVSSSHSSVASSSVVSSASVKPSISSSAVSSSSVASSSVTSSSLVAFSSVANSSAVTSQWLNDLNVLRAKERTPLTSDMVSDKGGAGSDEGKSLDSLTQDAEWTKWAQTRAEELAAQGSISHANMKNGAPTWTVNSGQIEGAMFLSPTFDFSKQVNGPESLTIWSVAHRTRLICGRVSYRMGHKAMANT